MTKALAKLGRIQTHWATFLATAVLACLVGVVFFPILGFEFIDYDVPNQVLENAHIRSLTLENLEHIFTSRCIRSYYPVRTLSFAVDYWFWGLDPWGFKLTNCLIHLTNVLLVFWLVLRLFDRPDSICSTASKGWDLSVATFSAGLFAVHPTVVEPVTWVSGREELLMTLGALASVHFYVIGRRLGRQGAPTRETLPYYTAATFCCGAACLSNAVAAVIPCLIVASDLLTLTRPKFRKIFYSTSALWVIAIATVVIKKLGSDSDLVANHVGAFSVQRLALVLNVYRLNITTLASPTQLAIEYSGIPPQSLLHPEVLLGGLLAGLTGGSLWLLRRQKLALFGILWFLLALAPTSQIMPHHVPRADRFLYLPLVGLAVALAMGLRPLKNALQAHLTGVAIAALGVWSLLAILSAGQVQTWQNSLSVWEQCLRVCPRNANAHRIVAKQMVAAGEFDRAKRHYYAAVLVTPDDFDLLMNLALLLATCPQEDLRDYRTALRLAKHARDLTDPPDPSALMAIAEIHAQTGRFEAAAAAIEEATRLAQAEGDSRLADDLQRRLNIYRATNSGGIPP